MMVGRAQQAASARRVAAPENAHAVWKGCAMLLPDKPLVKQLLQRYRAWERLMLADPFNAARRRHFEDTAYTLCVLMGRRTAREAAIAAENYLQSAPPSHEPVRQDSARSPLADLQDS